MFDQLPTELYESILSHVPASELQQTLLSVTRAIPLSPVPISHLFHSIRITYPTRAVRLYRRLRLRSNNTDLSGNKAVDLVKELSVECWSVDADVIVNLVQLLHKLQTLNIWIGPDNFTPEHLEEMFLKPFLELKYLSLRFRPYVQKATYYQFLKGAYFDSTLLAISSWPTVTLPSLSIIQDPLEPGIVQKQTFAQPIVFFRLDLCLSILIHSPALSSSLTSLRIQIPARPVARSLCTAAAYGAAGHPPTSPIPPDLVFLDLSTCGILENELDTLLGYFTSLQHIILDGCDILRGDLHDGEGKALGKRCALVGVRRAREKEKSLKSWMESRIIPDTTDDVSTGGSIRPARKAKPGRKGLSTATISFRTPSTNPPNPVTLESTLSLSKEKDRVVKSKKVIPKIRVLPPLPCLLSLSVTVPATIKTDDYPIIRCEFESGWSEGMAQLTATRARMKTSAGNGVRVMRLDCKGGSEESEEEEEGLHGLVDIDPDDHDAFGTDSGLQAPVLCFAGPDRDGEHQNYVVNFRIMTTAIPAIAYLKSFGGSIVDSYTGPRPPPVVDPPPSDVDDKTYEKSPEPPTKRIGALMDSLSSLPSAVITSSSSHVQVLRKKVLGVEHSDTLTSMGNLAGTYSGQGKWNEAEQLEVQVLDMRKNAPQIRDEGARPPPIVFPPPSWEIDDETYNKSPEPSELSKEPPITIARRIGALIDLYTGPRPPHVVFPPPSWEIDEETYKESPEPSELSTVPLISFARRMGALIDSLPTFPSAVAASLASSSSRAPPIQDDGKQDSPVHPEIDKDLIRMLGSEEVMNGQVINDTKSNPKGKKTPQQTGNVWNILASLKSNIALKRSETPSPSAVEEDDGSVMMYAPLEPTNDSKLELAESLLEYVDDPLPPASTESDERIEGSDASTSPTLPTPGRKGREKLKWVPSKTKISLLGTWWGYRLYLPPPVMAKLNGMSLEAAARAAMLTTALKWALNKIPLMLIPVQFRPAVKMLRMLSPIVGYVGVFIAWSWDRVKSLDEGDGVVLTATWLLPFALLPMSWDAGDIYGPRLASQQEKDAPLSHDIISTTEGENANKITKSSDNKEKQEQAKKKSIFPW